MSDKSVQLMSFSYRGGEPTDADMVFDVRFLRNPFYVESLKELTGLDAAAGDYIAGDPAYQTFFATLTEWLKSALLMYLQEKKRLTIALGCTGGKHRSVFVAERIAEHLRGIGQHVTVRHRDLKEVL